MLANIFYVDVHITNETTLTTPIHAAPLHPSAVNIDESIIIFNYGVLYQYNYSTPSEVKTVATTLDINSPLEVINNTVALCHHNKFVLFNKIGKKIKATNIECSDYFVHGHNIIAAKRGLNVTLYQTKSLTPFYTFLLNQTCSTSLFDPIAVNIFDVVYTPLSAFNVVEVRSPNKYTEVEKIPIEFYSTRDPIQNPQNTRYIQTYGSVIVIGLFGNNKSIGGIELYYDNFAVLHHNAVRFVKITRIFGGNFYDYRGISSTLDGTELLIGGMYQLNLQNNYIVNVEQSLKKFCNQHECACPKGYYFDFEQWKCHVVIDVSSLVIITFTSLIIYILSTLFLVIIYHRWALLSPATPPLLTPSNLTFGYSECVCPIHHSLTETLTITNMSDNPMQCVIQLPKSYRLTLSTTPRTLTIPPRQFKKVIITLTLHCTCVPDEAIVVSTGECAVRVPITKHVFLQKDVGDYFIVLQKKTIKKIKHSNKILLAIPAEQPHHQTIINCLKNYKINSRYLCSPVNVAIAPQAIILVYPFFGKTLNDVIRCENNRILLCKLCVDVCIGLGELHAKSIVHGLLCIYNVVVVESEKTTEVINSEKLSAKLIGWEIPNHLLPAGLCKDSGFSSELIANGECVMSDIFAFGVLLKEIWESDILVFEMLNNLIEKMLGDIEQRPSLDIVHDALKSCLQNLKQQTKDIYNDDIEELIQVK
ncbi:Protein kinase domain-containing protein [Entamoeba marina]